MIAGETPPYVELIAAKRRSSLVSRLNLLEAPGNLVEFDTASSILVF